MKNYWQTKKVLITGYEGFVGSNLTQQLVLLGANVTGLDINLNRKETILSGSDYQKINVIKGNVANYRLIKKIITDFQPEIVFHLAAETIVGKCLKNPLKTLETNTRGTWNVLESCRRYSRVKAVVVASSDKAYGDHKKLPYQEKAFLLGRYPYDVSKSSADLIAQAFAHTYKLPVVISRCGNIYGPGDFNFSRIIPGAIRSIFQNQTFLIRSDGHFTRDYIFVKDIINAYLLLAEKNEKLQLSGQAYNFSNEKPISVLDLVKMIYKIARKTADYQVLSATDQEIVHQYLSAQKAKKVLGWQPEYNLEKGLKETLTWYQQVL